MDIKLAYQIQRKQNPNGFSYTVHKQYQNTKKVHQKSKYKPKIKNKKSFIDQYISLHKLIPASNQYFKDQIKKKKSPRKNIDFQLQMKKGTKTFIDQIIKQKSKIPSVGQYITEVDNSQEIKKAFKIFNDKIKQKIPSFRPTTISQSQLNNPESVGPGFYQQQMPRSSSSYIFPPLNKQIQKAKIKQRAKSLSKIPGPASYRPQPANVKTFSQIMKKFQSQFQKGKKQNGFYSSKRSSLPNMISPGPKYSLISQWASQKNGNLKQKPSNILKVVNLPKQPSIYN